MMKATYNISLVKFSIWIFFLVAFSIKYICWDHSWNPPLNDFNEEILLLQEFDCWTRKSLSVMSRSSNICWSLIDVSIFFFFINWRIFSLAFSTPEKMAHQTSTTKNMSLKMYTRRCQRIDFVFSITLSFANLTFQFVELDMDFLILSMN